MSNPHPGLARGMAHREEHVRKFCAGVLADLKSETVGLEVGHLFLRESEPVLITDGAFLRNGRVSNFWDWVPIESEGFGAKANGSDNQGLFRALPAGTELFLDLNAAVPSITQHPEVPGVYRTPVGQLALVIAAGLTEVAWLAIGEDGRVEREPRRNPVGRARIQAEWRPLRPLHWSIRIPSDQI